MEMNFTLIIEGAEPFFLCGNKIGVLLIHGFTGSPAELLPLGIFLNRAGFTVLAVRLAGHGTSEKDLLRTNCGDWFNSVLDGYSLLKNFCDKIFVIGHSMGALLSLKLATLKPLDKLVTISPPFFIDESLHVELLPPRDECENKFVFKPRRRLKNVPPAVNKTYRKFPLISVHELVEIMDEVKNILPKVQTPILIFHAEDDHTAKFESAEFLLKSVASEEKIFVKISTGGHLIPMIDGREFLFEKILAFFKS